MPSLVPTDPAGPRAARETFFATCAPGLEPVLHEELAGLRLARIERQVGGVRFEGGIEDAWRANLNARTAVRILLRLARFEAASADALYAGASAVDWGRFLRPDGTFRVDAHSNESALDHTLFVEQRVKDAVADAFRARHGARPSVDLEDPELSIRVHLFRDRCTLSVDTSGESLHKRGWRRFQGRAPLAETLAAGIVLLSGWDRRSPLLDPFCGSGTVLIEAAWIAGGVPPGHLRKRYGFERWIGHDAARWRAPRRRGPRAGSTSRRSSCSRAATRIRARSRAPATTWRPPGSTTASGSRCGTPRTSPRSAAGTRGSSRTRRTGSASAASATSKGSTRASAGSCGSAAAGTRSPCSRGTPRSRKRSAWTSRAARP
jgi:putative N6-adenine-specific DNA methylase